MESESDKLQMANLVWMDEWSPDRPSWLPSSRGLLLARLLLNC